MGEGPHAAGAVSRHQAATAVDQFKGMGNQTVLTPADLKTGNMIYPYEKAK